MMKINRLKSGLLFAVTIVMAGLLMSSCNGKQKEFENLYEAALGQLSGEALLNKLLELDQKYPEQVKVKLKIGSTLLAAGDKSKARAYLKKAEMLINKADTETKGVLFGALALLEYSDKNYEKALSYADRSLDIIKDQEDVILFKARCLYLAENKDAAYALYELNWKPHKTKMIRDDLIYYSNLAMDKKNYGRVLEIMDLYQQRFEYNNGQGVEASKIYEHNGEIEKAVLAAVMDFEYLYGMAAIKKQDILTRLTELEKALKTTGIDPQGNGTKLIGILKPFFQGNYRQAYNELKDRNIDYPFFEYLRLVSRLEINGADLNLLGEYVKIEPYFKGFPTYYYHYWQGMKKGTAGYSFKTAKEVLEKSILLAPYTPLAREGRVEIGRLLGLKEADSVNLLLGPELDAIFNKVKDEKRMELLDPVFTLLATPDNVYQTGAVIALQVLAKAEPEISVYLDKQRAMARGRLKDRLVMIMGN